MSHKPRDIVLNSDFQRPFPNRPQNPALLSMMQDRLGSLIGKPSGYIKSLTPAVKRRVEGLKGIQTEHAKIESEFQREILEIEKKVSIGYPGLGRADSCSNPVLLLCCPL
jgi:hypothetical protein